MRITEWNLWGQSNGAWGQGGGMKIVAGVSSLKEIKYFLAHGASEAYCGFSQIGNHRPSDACFLDIAEVFEAIDIAHGFNKKIFLAVNETYHPDQYLAIDRQLEQ